MVLINSQVCDTHADMTAVQMPRWQALSKSRERSWLSPEAANSYVNIGSPNSHAQWEMPSLPAGDRKHQADRSSVDDSIHTSYTRTQGRTHAKEQRSLIRLLTCLITGI